MTDSEIIQIAWPVMHVDFGKCKEFQRGTKVSTLGQSHTFNYATLTLFYDAD
jgi:hypothetical protein